MKIVSSQIDGPIGSNVEDQAAGRWNSTPALPWATAAMGRLKDAFTYLQAGSKPKALEIAHSADLRQMNERGQSLMFAAAGRPLNKGSAELLCQILQKRGLAVDALDGQPPDRTLCSCAWRQWNLRRLADCTGVRSRPRWFQRRDTPLHCLPKLTDGNGHEALEAWSFFGCERHVMEVVSQRFLPTLFSAKPLRRSAKNHLRPRARQRSESVDKQRRNPCGSGSEGTYPCGAQAPMWWPNGHIKMRSFQMRQFQRKNAKRSWQRMMTSWSLFHPQKQQPGSVFWRREFSLDADCLRGHPMHLAMAPDEWADFSGVLVNEADAHKSIYNLLKKGSETQALICCVEKGSGCIRGYLRMSYGVGETVTLQHLKVQREHQRRGIATLMLEGWFAPGTRTPWVVLQANQLEGVLAESKGIGLLWENGISTLEAPPKAAKISSGWVEPNEEGDLRYGLKPRCPPSLWKMYFIV